MLRPACWLPAVRLAPLHGLLTPRSGRRVSPRDLGSATRRTDAYRHGTLTRWTGAASNGRAPHFGGRLFRHVTTHHAASLGGRQANYPTRAASEPAGEAERELHL